MGIYENNFLEKIGAKIGNENAQKMLKMSNDLLDANTDENGFAQSKVGLLVGKIQSGKTNNYFSLISSALDRNYDMIVVISGSKEILFNQNLDRMKEVFENIKNANSSNLRARFSSSLKIIDTSNTKSVEDYESKIKINQAGENNIIIQVMKEKMAFANFLKYLETKKALLKDFNVLIVDDEGDYGSLDGNLNSKRDWSTAWNQYLKMIKNILGHYIYLTVTATPFANYLLNSTNEFRLDFIKKSISGDDYCGLETFHTPKSKYIEIIPEGEIDDELAEDDSLDLSNSQIDAISFFLSSSFECMNKKLMDSTQMIVHNYRKINLHDVESKRFQNFIDKMQSYSKSAKIPNYFEQFISFVNRGRTLMNLERLKNTDDEIQDYIFLMENLEVKKLNRISNKEINDVDGTLNIYIGADLLDRGVTFENLICTYIMRTAAKNNADTLLQRARWFGYRRKYVDHMKIFMTDTLKNEFREINLHLQGIDEDLNFVDEGLMTTEQFLDSYSFETEGSNMRPTRINVNFTTTDKTRFWYKQDKPCKIMEQENEFWLKGNEMGKELGFGGRKFKVLDFKNVDIFRQSEDIAPFVFSRTNMSSFDIDSITRNSFPLRVIFMNKMSDQKQFRTVSQKTGKYQPFGYASADKFDEQIQSEKYFGDKSLFKYDGNKAKNLLLMYSFDIKDEDQNTIDSTYSYAVFNADSMQRKLIKKVSVEEEKERLARKKQRKKSIEELLSNSFFTNKLLEFFPKPSVLVDKNATPLVKLKSINKDMINEAIENYIYIKMRYNENPNLSIEDLDEFNIVNFILNKNVSSQEWTNKVKIYLEEALSSVIESMSNPKIINDNITTIPYSLIVMYHMRKYYKNQSSKLLDQIINPDDKKIKDFLLSVSDISDLINIVNNSSILKSWEDKRIKTNMVFVNEHHLFPKNLGNVSAKLQVEENLISILLNNKFVFDSKNYCEMVLKFIMFNSKENKITDISFYNVVYDKMIKISTTLNYSAKSIDKFLEWWKADENLI